MIARMRQEMFQRRQQHRSEFAAFAGNRSQPVLLDQPREKILRQVLCLVRGLSAPADEGVDGGPVSLVERPERRLTGRAILPGRLQHDRPVRALETRRLRTRRAGFVRLSNHGLCQTNRSESRVKQGGVTRGLGCSRKTKCSTLESWGHSFPLTPAPPSGRGRTSGPLPAERMAYGRGRLRK